MSDEVKGTIFFLLGCLLFIATVISCRSVRYPTRAEEKPPKVSVFAKAAARAKPAVVSVVSELPENPWDFNPTYSWFRRHAPFSIPRKWPYKRTNYALGSGFIVSRRGYVITNHHVIDNAKAITINLLDGRSFKAKLIGSCKPRDIALLKIQQGKTLPTVELGRSHSLRTGHWVMAIGNPFGQTGTVTAGIVSHRQGMHIQHDAAVNPGNSGGALIDLKGRVVGVNQAIISPTGAYCGISFSIDTNTVRAVAKKLKVEL